MSEIFKKCEIIIIFLTWTRRDGFLGIGRVTAYLSDDVFENPFNVYLEFLLSDINKFDLYNILLLREQ